MGINGGSIISSGASKCNDPDAHTLGIFQEQQKDCVVAAEKKRD